MFLSVCIYCARLVVRLCWHFSQFFSRQTPSVLYLLTTSKVETEVLRGHCLPPRFGSVFPLLPLPPLPPQRTNPEPAYVSIWNQKIGYWMSSDIDRLANIKLSKRGGTWAGRILFRLCTIDHKRMEPSSAAILGSAASVSH